MSAQSLPSTNTAPPLAPETPPVKPYAAVNSTVVLDTLATLRKVQSLLGSKEVGLVIHNKDFFLHVPPTLAVSRFDRFAHLIPASPSTTPQSSPSQPQRSSSSTTRQQPHVLPPVLPPIDTLLSSAAAATATKGTLVANAHVVTAPSLPATTVSAPGTDEVDADNSSNNKGRAESEPQSKVSPGEQGVTDASRVKQKPADGLKNVGEKSTAASLPPHNASDAGSKSSSVYDLTAESPSQNSKKRKRDEETDCIYTGESAGRASGSAAGPSRSSTTTTTTTSTTTTPSGKRAKLGNHPPITGLYKRERNSWKDVLVVYEEELDWSDLISVFQGSFPSTTTAIDYLEQKFGVIGLDHKLKAKKITKAQLLLYLANKCAILARKTDTSLIDQLRKVHDFMMDGNELTEEIAEPDEGEEEAEDEESTGEDGDAEDEALTDPDE